ncbi:MAG: SipW-dependent-type signal peptide-containing protein [Clostridia bacterium]|nr:SipW-dependent-type signal peptide-containing protein [Clostridia bacterium]
MKVRSTKNALIASLLVLTLCISMLIGSTFAWFTDTVVSENNIIKSGTLDIEMNWADGTEAVPADGAAAWKNASTGAIFNYDKWEPGYVEVRHIQIKNVGTLALKYQLNIKANGEVSKLADVIDVYYADPAVQVADRDALAAQTPADTLSKMLAGMSSTASGNLEPGASHTITIALKMQESAGNEYQNLSIGSDFAVQLYATQLTSEEDDFNDQYDAMATVDTEAELLEALAAGDNVKFELGANIVLTEGIEIPAGKTVTIDLQGYTLSQAKAQTAAYAMILNKGNLTIKDSVGTGKISYADTTVYSGDNGYVSNTISNQGTLTVKSGTIENTSSDNVKSNGYPHAIDAYQGSVTTIDGGTVKSANYDSIRMFCNSDTEATEVVINGGTIVNRVSFQDPNSTRPGYGILKINGGNFVTTEGVTANVRLLNFCANCSNMKATVSGGTFDKGFKTQDIANSGIKTSNWLTFVGADHVVANSTELQMAIDAAAAGDVIKLLPGKYDATVVAKSDITLQGTPGAIVHCVNLNKAENLTLQNIEFDAAGAKQGYDGSGTARQIANIISGDANKPGKGASNLVIDGCTFAGEFANGGTAICFADRNRTSGQSGNITIKNCTFKTEGAYYDIYCYYSGKGYMNIEGNTFESDCLGKPIYLGRYQSSTPVVVKGNAFNKVATFEDAAFIQDHSSYGVSFDAADNTFAN